MKNSIASNIRRGIYTLAMMAVASSIGLGLGRILKGPRKEALASGNTIQIVTEQAQETTRPVEILSQTYQTPSAKTWEEFRTNALAQFPEVAQVLREDPSAITNLSKSTYGVPSIKTEERLMLQTARYHTLNAPREIGNIASLERALDEAKTGYEVAGRYISSQGRTYLTGYTTWLTVEGGGMVDAEERIGKTLATYTTAR